MRSQKIGFIIFIILLFILISACCSPLTAEEHSKNTSLQNDTTIIQNVKNKSLIIIQVNNSTDPIVPSADQVKNGIHWSNYPLLTNGLINDCELSQPTPAINHSFLHITIHVDVTDTSNTHEILKQMAGIVREERALIGPDSFPNAWGFVDGGRYYCAWMWPYDDVVYATSSYGKYEKYTF